MRKLILCLFLCACTPGSHYYLQENDDWFKPSGNHDTDFTQGLRLGVETPDATGSHEIYGQQLFYTPENKKSTVYQAGARPYAGYIATGYKTHLRAGDGTEHTYGVEAGLIGPHAYGKETQRWFHGLIGQDYPKGWDTQLPDQFTSMAIAETRTRLNLTSYSDYTTLVGANAGTPFTQVYIGGTYRLGYHLDHGNFSGDPIFPRISLGEVVAPLSGYFFATGLGRSIAWNTFLDGEESVQKNPYVIEGRLGVVIQYGAYRVGYTYMRESREYKGERHPFSFGEVNFGVDF